MKSMLVALMLIINTDVVYSSEPLVIKRVILDEDFSWLKPAEADNVLERIDSAGFNVFVPVVWHGRGAAWESRLVGREPRWKERAGSVKDPLRVLIEKAHKKGIEVHPWFTVVLRQRDIFPEYYDKGTPKKAFNIHNEAFRGFIVELMLEVVRKYAIDGVNLDYIRSMGNCLSVACMADYHKKTGRDLKEDNHLQWSDPVVAAYVGSWNEKPITEIVKNFSEKARAIKPGLIISVDTHPINNRLSIEGARAIDWANNGYIDVIYDMQYKRQLDIETFKKAKSKLKDPSRLVLMIGNFEKSKFFEPSVRARDHGLVIRHMRKAIDLAEDSSAVALYELPYLSDEQIQALREGPFKRYVK